MNTFKKTEPWYGTEEILRQYLATARPYMKGRLLDAGCGAKRYKDLFESESYIGLEYSAAFNPDVVGDLRAMPFRDADFDSILSTQVLEHIDDTHAVFSEFHRVLRPGGHLCITVPFVSRIHEVPHDYWRMSEHGLRHLLKQHGFEEVEIRNMGGFLTCQAYLWQFWMWERLAGNCLLRFLRKPTMWASNHLLLFVHRHDRDSSTPFNYLAIARKTA